MNESPTPQGPINVQAVHQDHAAPPHTDDPLPPQPRPTRIVRGEAQFVAQLPDGAPASELAWAIANLHAAQTRLRLFTLVVRDQVARAHADNS